VLGCAESKGSKRVYASIIMATPTSSENELYASKVDPVFAAEHITQTSLSISGVTT
jgi:hypothetical protein